MFYECLHCADVYSWQLSCEFKICIDHSANSSRMQVINEPQSPTFAISENQSHNDAAETCENFYE